MLVKTAFMLNPLTARMGRRPLKEKGQVQGNLDIRHTDIAGTD